MAVDQGQGQGQPLWKVTHVDDSTMLGDRGGFQRSKKVYFQLADGTASFVEVPLTSFTKATVDSLIEQHVGSLLEVLNTQGPMMGPLPG